MKKTCYFCIKVHYDACQNCFKEAKDCFQPNEDWKEYERMEYWLNRYRDEYTGLYSKLGDLNRLIQKTVLEERKSK